MQWPTERLRLDAMAAVGDARRFDNLPIAPWVPHAVRKADVVVSAVGVPNLVRREWVRPGAVVLDVGIVLMAQTAEAAAPPPPPLQVGEERHVRSLSRVDVARDCQGSSTG